MTVDQLLFEVVRRLFEALTDGGVLEALDADIREALLLAYARTSLAFKETSSRARESSQTISLDLSRLGAPAAALGLGAPKLGMSRKRTDSMAREASFLAYSHADVEHDFLRILDLLNLRTLAPVTRRRRLRQRRPPWRGRLVVVLDELDKLTVTPEGVEAVDSLLMGLKNLLTARNVHFVFVGGPELHDAFMRDVARGNSVYESVFACHLYVPCLWQSSRELLGQIRDDADPVAKEDIGALVRYLDFKARGIPRLLIRELNSVVRWIDGRPTIVIEDIDAARVSFYAWMQEIVVDFLETAVDQEVLSMPIDEDRWRLGAYYITDWVLRRGASVFTIPEILGGESTPSPLMHASVERVERLVKHLAAHRVVEELWSPDAHHTIIGDADQASVYRLAPRVVKLLASFAHRHELERAELRGVAEGPDDSGPGVAMPPATPWMTSQGVSSVNSRRYQLGELIAVGGMGRIYQGHDRRLNREVAIKVLASHLLRDEEARGRWRREAAIAKQLDHPHIVHTYDVIDDAEHASAIVMELIRGPSLRAVLPLQPASAVAIADQLLSALAYAQDFGLARFDIKPENVVFPGRARAIIVDLGLVKRTQGGPDMFSTMETPADASGPLLGTPAYMSPEQARGGALDIRSDLYCVALVLYETIVGQHLRDLDGSPGEILHEARTKEPELAHLGVSDALRAVLTTALALEPRDRYKSPEEMRAALGETPEWLEGRDLEAHELLNPREAGDVRGRLAVMPAVHG